MKYRKLTILIVDDSLIINVRLSNILEEMKSLEKLIHAGSFEEGISLLKKEKPDIILLDINLPDKSGLELLRIIKVEYPRIKVIMISNYATEQYRNLCNALGAHYFFDKTYDFDKLTTIISKMN